MRGAIGCSPETFSYLDRLTKQKPTIVESITRDSDAEIVFAGVQQSLFDLIDAVSDEACLIVMIEDVHWLDSTSAKLLREMVAWAIDHSIFFAFTGRDRPEDWARIPDGLTEIHLPPLDAGASKDVILGVVRQHGRDLESKYLEWWVRVAEGNPYFLQELANHWVETGHQNEIPSSLAAVLNERISRLSAEALLLLQTCALLETSATLGRIEKLIGLEPHRMLHAINELGLGGMLVIETDDSGKNASDRLLSRHDLLSNAALMRLTPPARAFLHRRAGAVFEAEINTESSASTLWDCAKHWQLAGNVGRAFDLAQSCATHLMEVGLSSAAAEAYEKALAYCSTVEETAQILDGQTRAYYRSKNWGGVLKAAEKVRQLNLDKGRIVDRHDDIELMVLRAQWGNMRYDRILERTLKCLNEETATARHRVEAGTMSLKLLSMTGDSDLMLDVYTQIEMLATAPDVDASTKLQATAIFHTMCGSIQTAIESAATLLEENRRNGHVGDLILSLINAAVTYRTAGAFAEAENVLLEALSISNKFKIGHGSFEALSMLAQNALESGRNDDARHWCELLRSNPVHCEGKYYALELGVVSTRVALLSRRPRDAKGFLPRSWGWIRREPIVFRQTYFSCLYVATDLACGLMPSDALLDFLERAHIRARTLFYQTYPAHVLSVGLTAAGRKAQGERLLAEYLSRFRREPYPPSPNLVAGVQRLLTLTGKKRNRRGGLPAVLPGDSGT
jgi:predicted ATPase